MVDLFVVRRDSLVTEHGVDLVTGGLGFIGNELVRQLRARGPVAILDNRSRVAPHIDDLDDVPVYDVDVTDAPAVAALFERLRPRLVFHLAAIHYIPECNAHPGRTLRVNVEGTQSVLEAAARSGVERVVFASTGAIYADSAAPLAEHATIAPVDIYGFSKAFGEDLCRWTSARAGLSVIAARLFNNFGRRETNAHIIPEILSQLRRGWTLQLGNIAPVRDYIHTTDAASALMALAGMPASGFEAINVATGQGASVGNLIDRLAEALGHPIDVVRDAARFRAVDKQSQVADIALLQRRTNWRPRMTLADGLADLLAFEGFQPVARTSTDAR